MPASIGWRHLGWIVAAGAIGFAVSRTLSAALSPTLYQAVYVGACAVMFAVYVRRTRLPLGAVIRPRWLAALVLAALVGFVMVKRVLADPPSAGAQGAGLVVDVVWRGLLYGTVDGLLLSSFPWIVAWRALGGEPGSPLRRVGVSVVALAASLFVTTAYHAGYADFRAAKLVQAGFGNALMTAPTLVTMNPIASPIVHTALHVAVVLHDPRSELFLPPHAAPAASTGGRHPAGDGPPLTERGRFAFTNQGCLACHTIGNVGAPLGPDLSRVGAKYSAAEVERWLRDPEAVRPGAHMPPFELTEADVRALAAYLASLR